MKKEDLNNIVFSYTCETYTEIYKITNIRGNYCDLQDIESDWKTSKYDISNIIEYIKDGTYIILYKDSWFLDSSYGRLIKLFK